jgi:hypothetical protein
MSDSIDGRRKFLKTALISAGAFAGALAARTVAYAKLNHDPLVREMENRTRNSSIGSHNEMAAALCPKASCNPGCDSGCAQGCQTSCKPGNK